MAKSLQEQLLGAGLVDNKKAKAIKQEKRKQKKQQKQQKVEVDPNAARLAEERKAKQDKDRELNRQIQEAAREREIQAQIVQLIHSHRLDRKDGDTPYQFKDDKKIRKIYVTAQQQELLSKGRVAIARQGEEFELIPRIIADKIAERNPAQVITIDIESEQVDENDPYADYQIPDDLMW